MFKKRTIKKNNLKRVRDEDITKVDDDDTGGVELNFKLNKSKLNKPDNESSDPEEKPKAIGTDKNEKSDNLSKDNESLFKPDTSVKEQYHELEKNEKQISRSRMVQQRDLDGDKIYTGRISTKSRKDELVKPSSAHVKQNYIMDYQKDVCKDFLKNGYCGFGDTCKFLHYREEFKKNDGPEIKDWEAAAKRRKKF